MAGQTRYDGAQFPDGRGRIMLGLIRARSVSRTISARLEPFARMAPVSCAAGREEFGGGGWLPPRTLGFLTALVTAMARQAANNLPEHALASVQARVLAGLTGVGVELIGEEICLLSSTAESSFAEGAAAGASFFALLRGIDISVGSRYEPIPSFGCGYSAGDPEMDVAAGGEQHGHLQSIWDRHVTEPLSQGRG